MLNLKQRIELPKGLVNVFLPNIFALYMVLHCYGGDDALLVFFIWLDPFVFLFIPIFQWCLVKEYFRHNEEKHLPILIYSLLEITLGIIILSTKIPQRESYEVFSRFLFWYCVMNIISGVLTLKQAFPSKTNE